MCFSLFCEGGGIVPSPDDSGSSEDEVYTLTDYKTDRGGESIVIRANIYSNLVDTTNVSTVDVTVQYTDSLADTVDTVTVDEMGDYNYEAVINGNTLTFTDEDFSNTQASYMLTFSKDGSFVAEDIYNNNALVTVTYKLNFSDGTESKEFVYSPNA